jgi:hypothetical protein
VTGVLGGLIGGFIAGSVLLVPFALGDVLDWWDRRH